MASGLKICDPIAATHILVLSESTALSQTRMDETLRALLT